MIEIFLRSFINLQQTDCIELLPLVEFAYTNITISVDGIMAFYTNYSYHPFNGTTSTETNILSESSVASGHWMKSVVYKCKKELEESSERMTKYAHQSRIKPHAFERGNLVLLKWNNIKTHHPARELDHMMHGSIEILDIISPMVVRLQFCKMWKIYPIFYVSLIELCVTGNRDVNLNAVLKTFHPIENAPE
jgi:hypothetical protein